VAYAGLGYDYPHVAGVGFSRYAYFEAFADERCDTTTGFLERAFDTFNAMGIRAERLLSDTAENYVFHAIADFMQRLAALPRFFSEYNVCRPRTALTAHSPLGCLIHNACGINN
jgi:hypothetical protein